MSLLIFILACYGLTNILAFGKIFDAIRPKYYYFKCTMCLGFSVGVLVFIAFWFNNIKLFPGFIVGCLIFGLISSGISYALSGIFDEEGINIRHR